MWNLKTSVTNGFVFSELGDALAFALPVAIACLALPVLYLVVPENSIPLWAYIVLVALTDVGHVWTTLFRCYLDSEENARRFWLYNGTPLLLFALSFVLHFFVSEAFFWTLLGYLAIFHFVRQQYGFLCLAKRRGRDTTSLLRDKLLLYSGAVFPILLWHLDSTRTFDWFNRPDPFLHSVVGQHLWRNFETSAASSLSSSQQHSQSQSSSYLPLGRWSSRLFMEEKGGEENQQQQQQQLPTSSSLLPTNHRDLHGNIRQQLDDETSQLQQLLHQPTALWNVVLVIYAAVGIYLIVVMVLERREQQQQRQTEKVEEEQVIMMSSEQKSTTTRAHPPSPYYTSKHMILAGTWITWAFGVLCPHRVAALAFLNFFHAFPTFLTTFCTTFNRWLLSARHECDEQRFLSDDYYYRHHQRLSVTAMDDDDDNVSSSNSLNDERTATDDSSGVMRRRRRQFVEKNEEQQQQQQQQHHHHQDNTIVSPLINQQQRPIVDRFVMWLLLASPDGSGRTTPFLDHHHHHYHDNQRENRKERKKKNTDALKLSRFVWFLMLLFLLGLAEEMLWESLVWQDYTESFWDFDPSQDFSDFTYSAITALLILPQATHYFLDAFLWKHSQEDNPGLSLHMGMHITREMVPSVWLMNQQQVE